MPQSRATEPTDNYLLIYVLEFVQNIAIAMFSQFCSVFNAATPVLRGTSGILLFSPDQSKIINRRSGGPYARHAVSEVFPKGAFDTVPMLALLTMALCRHFKADCR